MIIYKNLFYSTLMDIYYLCSILGFIFSNLTQIPHLYNLIIYNHTSNFSLSSFILILVGYIFLSIFSSKIENKIYFISTIFKSISITITIIYIIKNMINKEKNNEVEKIEINNIEIVEIDKVENIIIKIEDEDK